MTVVPGSLNKRLRALEATVRHIVPAPSQADIRVTSGGIPTVPPVGGFPVVNLYVDSATGKLQVDYDDAAGASPTIISQPLPGSFAVTNLYVKDGKLTVEYENGV